MNENRQEEKNDGKVFPKEPSIKKGPGVGTRVIGSRNVKLQCLVGLSGVKGKVRVIWSRSCGSSVSFLLRSGENCQRTSAWGAVSSVCGTNLGGGEGCYQLTGGPGKQRWQL